MAKTAKTKKTEGMVKAVELTQSTAKVTLKGAIQTVEMTENYIQGMYNAGYDANYEGLKVAKNYWDATTEIRKDWLTLFAKTGEDVIDATAKMEVPSIKVVTDFGKDVYKNVSKTVENLTGQAKAAVK